MFSSAIAKELGDSNYPSPSSIYRWYRRYITFEDNRALIPRTDLRGSTALKQSKLVLKLAAEAIEQAFNQSPQAKMGKVNSILAGKIKEENQKNPLAAPIKMPSNRTVYRMLDRVELYEITQLKEGKKAAARKYKILKSGVKTKRILERVEVDHTPLDLFIIDEKTWLPLGRPLLTIIIDHYSRFPLGYYLTFESTSIAAVIGAMRHAILPKNIDCTALPKLKINHDWPAYGIPQLLVTDNGPEFLGNTLESICYDLRIILQFCPSREPKFKGVVERYLKTINYYFAAELPGASYAKFYQRGDYDPQKAALLSLGEFKVILEKWILDIYCQKIHSGIKTTPWDKWHESVNEYEPVLPSDIKTLQRRIGIVKERQLRRDGILINNIRYRSNDLAPILAKYGTSVQIRLVFDPEDLGEIQVWAPDCPDPISVPAIEYEYAKGLTFRQNELINQKLREKQSEVEDKVALLEARYEIIKVVQELMSGRKQKSRQRAAAIAGKTSNQPLGSEAVKEMGSNINNTGKTRQTFEKPSKSENDVDSEFTLPNVLNPIRD